MNRTCVVFQSISFSNVEWSVPNCTVARAPLLLLLLLLLSLLLRLEGQPPHSALSPCPSPCVLKKVNCICFLPYLAQSSFSIPCSAVHACLWYCYFFWSVYPIARLYTNCSAGVNRSLVQLPELVRFLYRDFCWLKIAARSHVSISGKIVSGSNRPPLSYCFLRAGSSLSFCAHSGICLVVQGGGGGGGRDSEQNTNAQRQKEREREREGECTDDEATNDW